MSRQTTPDARRAEKKLRRRERRPLRLRRLLSLLAVIGAGVLIGFRGGTASYLLFWATLMPPLCALIWRLTAGRRFQAAMRTDAPSALRGARPGCTLVLFNDSPLPIPAISVRMSGGRLRFEETEQLRVSLAPGELRELRFTPLCLHCGKAELGAAELRLSDPFALTEKRISAFAPLRIEPRRLQLRRLQITPPEERERHSDARMYLGERTPNGELRPYQPGDDVRRVHWKVSALQGRPMLRVTEPESRDELVLLPDLRDSLPGGEDGYLVEDSIREGSLALADWFLRRRIPLYVLPDERRALTVRTGEDLQRLQLLLSGDCFTGTRRTDEMMERDLAAGRRARRYILLTWEVDEALLRRAARCISLGAEVTLLCIGGGKELRSQAEAVQRLEFHQINARQDVIAVLSGGEEGAL
ncbi:MAG: DUF58 domain-containing protein [Oscillospiraceae bacterium]|nr:DUF58 domain-containing protein [Oscillospiraceae bacterium]